MLHALQRGLLTVRLSVPYSQGIPLNMALDSMPGLAVDQTQSMAPMELYESIWIGKQDQRLLLQIP